jgi:hypothetical protein
MAPAFFAVWPSSENRAVAPKIGVLERETAPGRGRIVRVFPGAYKKGMAGGARGGCRMGAYGDRRWASDEYYPRGERLCGLEAPSVLDALDLQHARAGALHVVHRRANRVAE